jgi:hypothetical protein
VVGEVRLLDEGIRPHLFQQVVLRQQPSGLFDESGQQVEGLRRQRHRLVPATQHALLAVELIGPELS